jgi:AraC-like DNA-binding protein
MKSRLPETGSRLLPAGWRCEVLLELFEQLPGVQFWVKDRTGRYLAMNRACLHDYGFTDFSEARGRRDSEISPAHIAEQFRLDDERVLKGQRITNRVELVGRFDHTAAWCVTNKVPLRDARGRIAGTAGVARPLGGGPELPQTADMALARAVEHLRRHIAQPVDNAVLARQAGISVRVLERRFREAFQRSPQQYHGFCDQSHFGREFRQETGMTPREYRLRFQKVPMR